ncbi:uncharacterized protein DC041_0001974, partial [Schistosoma bovis]
MWQTVEIKTRKLLCSNFSSIILMLARPKQNEMRPLHFNVMHVSFIGSQTKSPEKRKQENYNLDQQQQHSQIIPKELDQPDNDSHLKTDNQKNVSWKLNIDSDYEVDSLALARDGGILDWDDRVVDVLDDREL